MHYQTDTTFNRHDLSDCITNFIREFSKEDLIECKISDTDTYNLQEIANSLHSGGTKMVDFYNVDNDFRELSHTQIGKYFIKYFVSDDINIDLSKDDFYNSNNIEFNLC